MTRAIRPQSPWRESVRRKAAAHFGERLAAGFPCVFTLDGADHAETLQCRDEHDRTNWFGLKDICEEAIAAGAGDEPLFEPGIRCTSNRFYRPTYSQTLALLKALRSWVGGLQARLWALKDMAADEARESRADLAAIPVATGWPEPAPYVVSPPPPPEPEESEEGAEVQPEPPQPAPPV